jgi:hypothetical protein
MARLLSIPCGGLLAFVAASCALFSPSMKKLDMATGEYLLISTPTACTAGDFRPGVGTLVSLSHEGRDWVARSQSDSGGTVEFRFREVGNSRVAGVAVSGTLVGSGEDHRPFAPPGAGVAFSGGPVSVSAQTTPNVLNWIGGSATGQVVFRDGTRGSLTCARAEIALRFPDPCELDANVPCQ